jgi:Na+-transporting methylmalonyl-CoA/oxaloacetate decarboxylase gamma subunit
VKGGFVTIILALLIAVMFMAIVVNRRLGTILKATIEETRRLNEAAEQVFEVYQKQALIMEALIEGTSEDDA